MHHAGTECGKRALPVEVAAMLRGTRSQSAIGPAARGLLRVRWRHCVHRRRLVSRQNRVALRSYLDVIEVVVCHQSPVCNKRVANWMPSMRFRPSKEQPPVLYIQKVHEVVVSRTADKTNLQTPSFSYSWIPPPPLASQAARLVSVPKL